MRIELSQKAVWLDSDVETPISLYLNRIAPRPGVLLESVEVDGRWGRYSLAAHNFLLVLACREGRLALTVNDPRLEPLRAFQGQPYLEGLRRVMKALNLTRREQEGADGFPPITRGLYGYLAYGAAGLMEKKLARALPPEEAEGLFVLPGTVYLFDHTYNRLVQLSLLEEDFSGPGACRFPARPAPPLKIGPVESSLNQESYRALVGEVKELIRRGEAIQVVAASQFSAPFEGGLFTVYRRLRRLSPSPYMFYLEAGGFELAVSSPEVMVSCSRDNLRLCPIAGTRPRGDSLKEDDLFEEQLASDPKEQAEHVMLVDLGRNDLGRVAAPGTVKVERFMEVERFSHVMHLTSYLGARLAPGRDVLDVLTAAFPAGTLSGAPKIRAMEIIAEKEPVPRGPYGGAIGWLGLDQDSVNLDLGITIRGLWARGGRVFWQAGAGLVYDSDPETEWRECLNKAASVQAALESAAERPLNPQGGSHVSFDR